MSASATQGGHNKGQQQWLSGYNSELYHSIPSLIHINTSVSYWWRQKGIWKKMLKFSVIIGPNGAGTFELLNREWAMSKRV